MEQPQPPQEVAKPSLRDRVQNLTQRISREKDPVDQMRTRESQILQSTGRTSVSETSMGERTDQSIIREIRDSSRSLEERRALYDQLSPEMRRATPAPTERADAQPAPVENKNLAQEIDKQMKVEESLLRAQGKSGSTLDVNLEERRAQVESRLKRDEPQFGGVRSPGQIAEELVDVRQTEAALLQNQGVTGSDLDRRVAERVVQEAQRKGLKGEPLDRLRTQESEQIEPVGTIDTSNAADRLQEAAAQEAVKKREAEAIAAEKAKVAQQPQFVENDTTWWQEKKIEAAMPTAPLEIDLTPVVTEIAAELRAQDQQVATQAEPRGWRSFLNAFRNRLSRRSTPTPMPVENSILNPTYARQMEAIQTLPPLVEAGKEQKAA